ncbi:FAD linked oxidase domain protein [Stanieria cyanosphaera PCC 7437]|uniref:FAD linked oxidase domain protein n=1 Tax=Stanieria cyanosphaera (strain ATCC 29371 / PCC 7437) TaxID=111780 RepID=K9XY42_STAC7|nr:FAD-binding oxidoreductase [Stanieria cyanosphaera]AFZ36979.1 FAD linked oxidase domain protein [Stanieria cyanosphaera PCC 7437]
MTTHLNAWQAIADKLKGIEIITESNQIAKLSLDYYHFSPILYEQLKDKRADLVVRPSNEAEVIKIAQLCYCHQVPLTVRGAGTGNYGQCIPLEAGIILDTTKMNQIHWLKPGMAAVEPGVKMAAFDKQAREIGWELRIAPSTYRTATIGGFIGGGSVGMGSITYGQLKERGNLQRVRLVTMTETPEVIELSGDEVQQVIHGYGTTGIITQLEIPLAPAYPWAEMIVIFDQFMSAAKFGQALSDSDGIVKKLVSIHAAPIPSYFTALQNYLPSGKHCALLMISEYDLAAMKALIAEYQGEITYCKKAKEIAGTSLLEFAWNHTTLHARSVDPNLTYLQTFYFTLERVEQMYQYFGDEVVIHLEFLKAGGKAVPAGLQLVRYTTATRLNQIIDYHEANGAFIANPHVYTIEAGGNKTIDHQKVQFKHKIDPCGLLNPGKMSGFSKLNLRN